MGTGVSAGNAPVIGTRGPDHIVGDGRANLLVGELGNDLIEGGDGDDTIDGGLSGVVGLSITTDDTLLTDDDTLSGGGGTDTLSYGSVQGQHFVLLGNAIAIRYLPPGTETPQGVTVSLLLQGAPQDTIGAGIDTLWGFENLTGSLLADHLTGDGGNNVLKGLDGDDILEGGLGINRLDGGDGLDLASYAGAAAGVTVHLSAPGSSGGAGIDYFTSIEGLLGSAFADTLVGDAAANILRGGAGNDRLFGQAGDDTLAGDSGDDQLNGGDGTDTADYTSAAGPLRVILGTGGSVDTISAGRDLLLSIENLVGGSGKDFLVGDGTANRIEGGAGDDTIEGRGGDDMLLGGVGNDSLTGGLGADVIAGGLGFDTIRYGAATESRFASLDYVKGFTVSGDGYDRIGFANAAGALFAGVEPAAIALGALRSFGVQAGGGVSPGGGSITLPPGGSIGLAAASISGPLPVPGGVAGGVSVSTFNTEGLLDILNGLTDLAASTADTLVVTQVRVFGYVQRDLLVVSDTTEGFDAGSDMVIAIETGAAALRAVNVFLF